jgi:hypothetical protein
MARAGTLLLGLALTGLMATMPAIASTAIGRITTPLAIDASGSHTLGLNISGDNLQFSMRPSSVTGGETIRMVNLDGYPVQSNLQTFQGKILGQADSWVRVGIAGDVLSGVVSKAGTRYQLGGSVSGLVTMKLLSEQSSHSLGSHATQLRTTKALSSTPITHVVDVAIAVDSQYNAIHDGRGLEKALSIINSVDGIYREEFGLALRVVSALNITERANDPFDFGHVGIETMLRGLRDFRMRSSQFDDASLVHLFTGNQNSDAPVGLAWIDTACRTDGYDVGLSTPYRHEILLAAHEIAHNLGAVHDSETACNVESDKVMWPYISSQTSQHFSSCTRSSVRQALQNSCHVETIDLQVSLAADDISTYTATVKNNHVTQSSTSAKLIIDLPDNTTATALNGDCVTPDEHIECAIGTLLPGAEDQVRLSIENFNGEETAQWLVASVEPEDAPDLARDNNIASIYRFAGDTNTDNISDDAVLVNTQSGQTIPSAAGGNSANTVFAGGGAGTFFLLLTGIIVRNMRGRQPL